jgi:hypothetical protein
MQRTFSIDRETEPGTIFLFGRPAMTTHRHTLATHKPPFDWNNAWNLTIGALVAGLPLVDYFQAHELTGNHYAVSALGVVAMVGHWLTRR